MRAKNLIIADAEAVWSIRAPVVLRLFHLFIGDPALAESLTIETLGEQLRASGVVRSAETEVVLLRRAYNKGMSAAASAIETNDPLIRAVAKLEPLQRAIVVFVGGLSLSLPTVAEITGLDVRELNRICLEAFSALHRSLPPAETEERLPTVRE